MQQQQQQQKQQRPNCHQQAVNQLITMPVCHLKKTTAKKERKGYRGGQSITNNDRTAEIN